MMGKTLNKATPIIIILKGLLAFTVLNALGSDDVIDSINKAVEYYKEGALEEAVRSLNDASQLIQRSKEKKKFETFLPKPLEGWTADVAHTPTGGRMVLSITPTDVVEREYRKGSRFILIRIAVDPPTLSGILIMYSNPSMIIAGGGKMRNVEEQKAIVKYDPSDEQGMVNLVVAERYLITVIGRRVNRKDLIDYASAIDFKQLEKF
jgi:hypothetical protein